jgi:hypothetical protein
MFAQPTSSPMMKTMFGLLVWASKAFAQTKNEKTVVAPITEAVAMLRSVSTCLTSIHLK